MYLDGEYVATIILNNSQNGRFCLNNNWGVQSSNFFSDNDGETNPLFVSSIQLRNYAMSKDEIKELGKPKANKINSSILLDTTLLCPEFENEITASIQDNFISLYAFAGDNVNYKWEMNRGLGWENVLGINFLNSASPMLKINYSDEFEGVGFRCLASNDCQTISNEYILQDINTEIKWNDKKENLLIVYPNPSKGNVTIDFSESTEHFTVRIYTIQGAKIFQKSSVSNKLEVNLAPGTYLVQVQNNLTSETKKLLIIK